MSTTPVLILDVSSLNLSQAAGTIVVSTPTGVVLTTCPGTLTDQACIYDALTQVRHSHITAPGPDGKATPALVGLYIPRTGHICLGDHVYQVGARPVARTGLPAHLENTVLHLDGNRYETFTVDAPTAASGWASYRN